MSRTWMTVIALAALASMAACLDPVCDNGKFCDGISVQTSNGGCTPLYDPCDDDDEETIDTCDETSQLCNHVLRKKYAKSGESPCRVDCAPDCAAKQCGEDGCGGFCGECPEGEGCFEGQCVVGLASGTCSAPYPFGNFSTIPVIDVPDRLELEFFGDTFTGVHMLTPQCNALTAAPELIYSFVIPAGHTYGIDFRSFGYDTVLQVMKDECSTAATVTCSDDATPPSNYGSRVSAMLTEGTYYVLVDGYSSLDYGNFTLTAIFVRDCLPLCDGSFCEDDSCGGTCGHCGDGETCAPTGRCYPDPCTPMCVNRTCGEDGCGGSCGNCTAGSFCVGEAFMYDDEIQTSSCVAFDECNHTHPVCDPGCADEEYCANDCTCYNSTRHADFIIIEQHLLDETYLEDLIFPPTSCALVEGCVDGTGLRRLLRFTSSVLNQGHVVFQPADPKSRPDQFEWGTCHSHYHYKDFAIYRLYAANGTTLVTKGRKAAYCLEDTVRHFDGPSSVSCNRVYDCGAQGVQNGWLDSYGYALDCSWIDVTDIEPGEYVLEVEVNPNKAFAEVSLDNNVGRIRVVIPDMPSPLDGLFKVATSRVAPAKAGSDSVNVGLVVGLIVGVIVVLAVLGAMHWKSQTSSSKTK